MKTLERIDSKKFRSIEPEKLSTVYGGVMAGECTGGGFALVGGSSRNYVPGAGANGADLAQFQIQLTYASWSSDTLNSDGSITPGAYTISNGAWTNYSPSDWTLLQMQMGWV